MMSGPVSKVKAAQHDADSLLYTPDHTEKGKPMFPAFAEYSKRLESFHNLPDYFSINTKDLAEAGLVYTGIADVVRCYSCGGGHSCWIYNHIPMEEHARLFPECPHILQVKGKQFVKEICRRKNKEMHVGTAIQEFEKEEVGYLSRHGRKTYQRHIEFFLAQGYSRYSQEVKEDTEQIPGRHRVSLILQSEAYCREMEELIEGHLEQNNASASRMALQQISDLLFPNHKLSLGTEKKQKPDADNVHLKKREPSITAGAIIGQGGETIAAVQKEADALVKVSTAKDFCQNADNVHLKILVPSIAARAIIGKGGETIAAGQNEAGTGVKVSNANDLCPEKPKIPKYAVFAKRLESFRSWPESLPIDKKGLAEAGFAYIDAEHKNCGKRKHVCQEKEESDSCYLHPDLLRRFREESCKSERKKDKSLFNNKQGWAIKIINSLMNVINGTLETATEVMSLLVQKCPELFPNLDRTPTQKDLLSFAQAIGENFRYFGLALGVGDVSLDQISMENPTVVMKTFTMLKKWCDENPLESSLSRLIQTLKTCSCVRVDWGQIGKLCL